MTVRNLITLKHFKNEKQPKKAFEDFYTKNEKEFKNLIHENSFESTKFEGKIKKENLYFDMSIGILIDFDEIEMKLLKEESRYREDIFEKEIKNFHMTLAYWIKDPKLNEEEVFKLKRHIEKIPQLKFFSPTLCFFENMKEFFPIQKS